MIAASPADGVRAPRSRRPDVAMKVLDADQVRTVLVVAGDFRPFLECASSWVCASARRPARSSAT